MPVFRVEGGRPVVVHPLPPALGAFDVEVPAIVAEHLGALLGEPMHLVAEAVDGPPLLALDGAGKPVVIEIVAVLDEPALLTALRHAGQARRPASTAGLETGPGPASDCRLVLVCAEVRGVQSVLDLLQAQGWLTVLLVGVLTGHGGERWLDVSPRGPAGRRTRRSAPDVQVAVATAERLPEPEAWASTAPGGRDGPTILPPPPGSLSTPLPRRTPALHQAPRAAGGTVRHPPAPQRAPERLVVVPVAADAHRVPGDRPARDLPYAFTGVLPTQSYRAGPDARLLALARSRREPTVLVWHRARRGVSYEALLHLDGVIELPDGTRVTDPSAAAEMASAAQGVVDGWTTWRVDTPSGPTLAEACASAVSA